MALPPLSTDRQARALRGVLGTVYLACTVMLVLALVKFVTLILPRYGGRFGYMVAVMAGLAGWMAFHGLRLLFGRGR